MTIKLHFTSDIEFTGQYEDAVLQIRARPEGRQMMEELENTDRPMVTVRRQPNNTCGLATNNVTEAAKACYEESLDDKALSATLERLANEPGTDARLLQWALKKAGAELVAGEKPKSLKLIVKSGWSPLQRCKAAYHVRQYLKAGPGAAAMVHWNPTNELASQGLTKEPPPWDKRPPWIALAHELIHAWHYCTGRVVFDMRDTNCGMYEDYMTVGIPPYEGGGCTENLFRMATKDVAQRHYYGDATKEKSLNAWKKYG